MFVGVKWDGQVLGYQRNRWVGQRISHQVLDAGDGDRHLAIRLTIREDSAEVQAPVVEIDGG